MSTAPVPSPCTGVCRIDPRTALCAGCARSLDEIAAWSRLSDEAKRAVWAELPKRTAASHPPSAQA
ncbi:DUF1289 domain-containing protein [Ideonella paludis]|uniref:DUF1289 domain-containing protein n=1 Tax=Ideonella paludis TaxID=1233411 RepID=A0ABS5DWT7_9BURK|nr:DUF1289 domain-containing protein [Ideonella paludis]